MGRVLDEIQQVLEGALAGDSGLAIWQKNIYELITITGQNRKEMVISSSRAEPHCPQKWHQAAAGISGCLMMPAAACSLFPI